MKELHCLSTELHSLTHIHTSISWQQSRLQWLREGDPNSKYFHGTMSSRQQVNAITTIRVGGVRVEGVFNVREVVFMHFPDHFK